MERLVSGYQIRPVKIQKNLEQGSQMVLQLSLVQRALLDEVKQAVVVSMENLDQIYHNWCEWILGLRNVYPQSVLENFLLGVGFSAVKGKCVKLNYLEDLSLAEIKIET